VSEHVRRSVGPLPPPPPPVFPPPLRPGVPDLIFTQNGVPIPPRIPAPRGANDLHISWAAGVVWWTLFGLPLLPFIPIPPNANDFWFRLRPGGAVPQPLNPPPGANDVEFYWDGDRLTAAWWTRDGVPLEPIPLSTDAGELHVSAGPERETY
jgi:hypothetical protein